MTKETELPAVKVAEAGATVDEFVSALVILAEAGIPTDIQELLVRGDPMRGIKPNALYDALGFSASEHNRLKRENEHFTKSGIIEVAVRNISVSDYMDHWEGRALAAESRCEELVKALEFYADDLTWADTNPKDDGRLTVLVPSPSFAEIDRGEIARAAVASYHKRIEADGK